MRRVLVPHEIAAQAPPPGAWAHRLDGATMGTTWRVQWAGRPVPGLDAEIAAALARLNDQMSHWQAGSELDRFNRAPAGAWLTLAPEFHAVLACGLAIRDASGGAFDPCAGALVDLWGFGAHGRYAEAGFAPPDADALAAALAGSRAVRIDPQAPRAFQPGGARLDLSGIAKGYAVDFLAALLEARGIAHYLVEIGGELRGAGVKPDGQPWWVALEEAGGEAGGTVLALHGLACATSGDQRRFFDFSGRRYAHTLDPRSGRPVDNGTAVACVIHPRCMVADAWATALTVLGPERGIAAADARGLAARLLVREGGRVAEYLSAALRALLD